MRVVCDVPSITREFDYLIPGRLLDAVGLGSATVPLGTMVRVPLHGRQVPGWVVAADIAPADDVELRAVTKISGLGPSADVIDLCRWAAWRWAGRLPTFLGTASPPTMVRSLPSPIAPARRTPDGRVGERVRSLFDESVSLIRLPPAASPLEVVRAAAERGPVLVVTPTIAASITTADAMRRAGITTAVHPDGWPRGAAGSSIVGPRAAAFAPVAGLGAIVVLDEHDEALQNEGSPTWHAREVAVERGRRAGVPVVLVSPVPSPEALQHAGGRVVTIDRARERRGWATLRIVDRREDDIVRTGLYSDALVRALQSDRRVLCVLNRTGRAPMLACLRCGVLAACERCGAAVRQDDDASVLNCPSCATIRPAVCLECPGTAFRHVRIGVTKAREQLEALLREPVDEITRATRRSAPSTARVSIGTEAVLQRVDRADVVAFLEFDQELGAPRYRATDEALGLLARASRIVGGRAGEILVQTRQPDHPVLRAALLGDPIEVTDEVVARRRVLSLPPFGTVVAIGGEAAAAYVDALTPRLAEVPNATVDQRDDSWWLVRSPARDALLDALGNVTRPAGRLRLQVDPARLPT